MLQFQLIPFPTLSTNRLLLRQVTVSDAPALLRLRSNLEVIKYLDRAPMQNLDEALSFIERNRLSEQESKTILWAICLKTHPENMLGTIGFWKTTPENFRAEIGYMLLPEAWNKGLMQEAIAGIKQYVFSETNLHSIEADINPANKASAALLEKSGFVQEAYFRENFFYNGKFLDSAIYSLVKPT